MYSIVAGTILLGITHALIPNHWLPLVAVAKSEKWERYELMLVASITASAHKKSKTKWVLIFAATMFLSPCLEVESFFLAAGAYGWDDIIPLVFVYAAISITGIVSLIMLAYKGFQMINSHFIEHNEKRITGMVLIIVGIVTFFLH